MNTKRTRIPGGMLSWIVGGDVYAYTWEDTGCKPRVYDGEDGPLLIDPVADNENIDVCAFKGKKLRNPETGEISCEAFFNAVSCEVIIAH